MLRVHNFSDIEDANQIKVPGRVAEQVLQAGSLDYRPLMGETSSVIQMRKTNNSLGSYFKSGRSLNK